MATDFTNLGGYPTKRRGDVRQAPGQRAAGKTADPRRVERTIRFAFAATFVLLLGAMPQDARAKACESQQLRLGPGCVTAKDIKPDDLTAKDRLDEPGMSFVAPPAAAPVKVFSASQGATKVFATFSSKIPAGGVVIVTASAVLSAAVTDTYGAVECDIIMTGPPPVNRTTLRRALFGSVDDRDSISFDSMAFMTGLALDKKMKITFELKCGLSQGAGVATNAGPFGIGQIDLQAPSVTVQYFPTRY